MIEQHAMTPKTICAVVANPCLALVRRFERARDWIAVKAFNRIDADAVALATTPELQTYVLGQPFQAAVGDRD